MADQFAIVTLSITNGVTGVRSFTDPSITAAFSAAILFYSRTTTDDSNEPHGLIGCGFIDAAGNQRADSCSLEDNQTGQDNETEHSTTQCVRLTDGSAQGVLDIEGEFSAAISGGVQVNFTRVDVGGTCTAILFAGLARAHVGDCTFNDVAASHEDVGPGGSLFEPDVVAFRSSDVSVNATHPNGTLALGFALNRVGVPQISAYVNCADRTDPTDSDGYVASDQCSTGFQGTTRTFADRFHVTSFDSTGFNAQAVDAAALTQSPQANYLALKFSEANLPIAISNFAVSSSAGAQMFTAGVAARLVFGMATLMTAEDTLTDGATASVGGYFAFTSSAARAYSVRNREALDLGGAVTSEASTRQGAHAVLLTDHLGAVAQQASVSSMDSNGFTLDFSTASTGFLTALVIGTGAQAISTSDTEDITESVVAFMSRSLALTESVEISESVVMETFDVTTTNGPAGTTLDAGSKRGTSYSGGSVAGTVL